MKIKKFLCKAAAFAGVAVCSLSLFFVAPQTSITAQAAGGGGTVADPQAEIITWVYIESGGILWKRLWNGSTGEWLTDWIFVRYL